VVLFHPLKDADMRKPKRASTLEDETDPLPAVDRDRRIFLMLNGRWLLSSRWHIGCQDYSRKSQNQATAKYEA
jgi:hypothetical protein